MDPTPFGTEPRDGRWRRALVYFGLVEGDTPDGQPDGQPDAGALERDVADLRRRVAELEAQVASLRRLAP
jgi:hypothetical protein